MGDGTSEREDHPSLVSSMLVVAERKENAGAFCYQRAVSEVMLISVSVHCLQGTTLPYGYCRENRKLIAFNYDIYNTGCMWWILEKCKMTKKEPNFEYTAHLRCGTDFQASDLPKRNGPALCWRPSRNHCWFRNPQRKDISDIAVKMKEGLEKLKRSKVVCLVGRMDTLFQF